MDGVMLLHLDPDILYATNLSENHIFWMLDVLSACINPKFHAFYLRKKKSFESRWNAYLK